MTETRTGAGPSCTIGHRHGRPVPAWEMGALAPAGTLRSSATDLLRYLQAHLHPEAPRWLPSCAPARCRGSPPRARTEFAWCGTTAVSRYGDVLTHSSATRGFTAFVGFCPQAATGVAALANTTPTLRRNMIPAAYSLFKTLIRENRVAAA